MVAQHQVFSILIPSSALKFSHQCHSIGQLKMLYSQTLKLNVQIVRVLHCEQWQLRWIQSTRNILHHKSCTRKADKLFFQHKYYNCHYNVDAIRTQKPRTGNSSELMNNVSKTKSGPSWGTGLKIRNTFIILRILHCRKNCLTASYLS